MKYSITNDTITIVVDGDLHTIHAEDDRFEEIVRHLVTKNWEEAQRLILPATRVIEWSEGAFQVEDGVVKHNGRTLPDRLSSRMMRLLSEGHEVKPFMAFWERLEKNPSMRSVQQLYNFLEHENIPITEDGCFMAYKSVTMEFKDWHTGNVDNSVGVINEMPRNQISDDPQVGCHFGFHVGALNYAANFGGYEGSRKIIICKIDPADVVCVPYDDSCMKVRVCKYKVVDEYTGPLPSTVVVDFGSRLETNYEPEDEEEDDNYLDDFYDEN